MEITPAIGIGDFLILKMICVSNDFEIKKINLSTKLLNGYRQYPDRFYQFLLKFIKMLFPKTIIDKTDNNFSQFPHAKYTIKSPYIYDHLCLDPIVPSIPHQQPYIAFHNKVRFERTTEHFMMHELPLLEAFLKTFHTNKTIVLMGERVVEECYEQRVLGIISLYPLLMRLKERCHVVDLTKEVLYSGNPDYDDFVRDLDVIHRADLNVTFGIGGPLNICQSVSQRNLAFVGFVSDFRWIIDRYNGVHHDMPRFLQALGQQA